MITKKFKKIVFIQIRVDEPLKKKLDELSKINEVSMSEIVRQLVDQEYTKSGSV
jgi:predicted transcriptional regulator